MEWNAYNVERLRRLKTSGLYTYNVMACILGVSRGSVSSAVRRYIYRIPDIQPERKLSKRASGSRNPQRNPNTHTLTEPWAVFHARKQKERAEAKAAALQVTPTVQVSRES